MNKLFVFVRVLSLLLRDSGVLVVIQAVVTRTLDNASFDPYGHLSLKIHSVKFDITVPPGKMHVETKRRNLKWGLIIACK